MVVRLSIGCDHRGFELKQCLLKETRFGNVDVTWHDVGAYSSERTDYPLYTFPVVKEILNGTADAGILLCGSGIGVSIAANRFKGIYAGIVWNVEVARLAKEHDNVNLLILPADYIEYDLSKACITAWLQASFLQERYQKRLEMIEKFPGL